MSGNTGEVDLALFSHGYSDKAERLFLHPDPTYHWKDIVSGVKVCMRSGGTRRIAAVGGNTFRGFHRVDKASSGSKEVFVGYFLEQESELLASLATVATRDEFEQLAARICTDIRARLKNCVPEQLRSYNKVRKPVDLYFENLVCMASECDELRDTLVPLLSLPLDSEIIAHPGLFTVSELTSYKLNRGSTYQAIGDKSTYDSMEAEAARKAQAVGATLGRPFHPIYFDLLWNERYRNEGGNLFESNP